MRHNLVLDWLCEIKRSLFFNLLSREVFCLDLTCWLACFGLGIWFLRLLCRGLASLSGGLSSCLRSKLGENLLLIGVLPGSINHHLLLVEVLGINVNALVSQAVPRYESALLDNFARLFSLVYVIHQLTEVTQEFCIVLVILHVLFSMSPDFCSLNEGCLDMTGLNENHKINFIESPQEVGVLDSHGF